MSDELAEIILDTARRSLGLSIAVTPPAGAADVWRIEAIDPDGETWTASGPDFYKAAVMLAVLMGFDLE